MHIRATVESGSESSVKDPLAALKYSPRDKSRLHLLSLLTLTSMYGAAIFAGRHPSPLLLGAAFLFNLFCSVRYTGYIHALNHAYRSNEKIPWLLELFPVAYSPFIMGFSGFRRIHNLHHLLETKAGDPDNFLIAGESKLLILFKCSLTFEHWFFYAARHRWLTERFWPGYIIRLAIFAGLARASGPLGFLVGFLLPIKIGTAISFYVFSYLAHVNDHERGVYLLPLPPLLKQLNYLAIGRNAAQAANVHTIHHEKPWIACSRLEEADAIVRGGYERLKHFHREDAKKREENMYKAPTESV